MSYGPKPFRFSAQDEGRIKQEALEQSRWEKLQMLYPQRPPCFHSARTADLKRTHWHRFTGLVCDKASVTSRTYGPNTPAFYYCADHAPELPITLTDNERQSIIDEHSRRASPALARIHAIRQCHLYYSPELLDARVEAQAADQGHCRHAKGDERAAEPAKDSADAEACRFSRRDASKAIVEQSEMFA